MRYGEGAAKLEGANLARFMTVLNEYLGFFDKVDKRLRDEQVTELLPKLDLAKRVDFEGDKKTPLEENRKAREGTQEAAERARLQERSRRVSMKSTTSGKLPSTNSQGAEHVINWELASTPEYRQLISKFKQIEQYMEPPFVVETIAKAAAADKDEEPWKRQAKLAKRAAKTKTGEEGCSEGHFEAQSRGAR